MATITVRALSPTGEPLMGNQQNNFISDLAAVAQIIRTRLLLFQGEWFLNLNDGLPMFNGILGSSGDPRNLQTIIAIIRQRIQATPYVTNVLDVSASFQNRQFVFSAEVQTQFGVVTVSNAQGSISS
jgi:hypothetical protein